MGGTGVALVRSGVVRCLSMAVTMATMFALVPLMVSSLGDHLYGAWLLIGTILGSYGLLDLGLSTAVSRFVARALGQNDRAEADRYITTATLLFALGGLVCILATTVIGLLSHRFVSGSEDEAELFRHVVFITGFSFGLASPSRSQLGVLEAHLRYDLSSLLEIGLSLSRAVLFVLLLWGGGKLLALALASGGVSLARAAATIVMARRVHGPIRFCRSNVTGAHARTLLAYGAITLLAQISDLLRMQIYPFVIEAFKSLAAVTPYGIAVQVVGAITRLGTALLATTAPVFSRLEAQAGQEVVRRSFLFNYKLGCYYGGYTVGIAAVLGRAFIIRWVGLEHSLAADILYVLLVSTLFNIISIPTIYFMYGTSNHHYFAIVNVVEGVVNLVLSIVLIRSHGLLGMAVGTAAAGLLSGAVLMPVFLARILKASLYDYYLRWTLPNLLRPAVFIVLLHLATRTLLAPSYGRLVLIGSIASLLFIPYIFYIGFDRREREMLVRSVRFFRSSTPQPPTEAASNKSVKH